MFRYTPPWKVLCHSLDPDNKRLSNEDYQPVWSLQSPQQSRGSLPQSEPPSCVCTVSPTEMNSYPRNWVMKPLSPLLQPSDLRTIAGPAPSLNRNSSLVLQENDRTQKSVVEVRHVAVFQDGNSSGEEWQPTSPCSSTGSQSGFYSFVDDPTSPEAEMNEAWMMSPQRQAQLAILKKEREFKLQTYSSNKKPQSLFSESNGDYRYRVDHNSGVKVIDENDEKQFRKMIIHSQAPRRSQRESLTQGESMNPSLSTDRLIDGFSLSFSPISSRPEPPHSTEPGTVVKEQINFGAARQKFLQMEQERLASMLSPLQSSRTQLNTTSESDLDGYGSRKLIHGTMNLTDDTIQFKPAGRDEPDLERKVTVIYSNGNLSRESSVFDDIDSGHDEVSGGYTSDDAQLDDIDQDHRSKSKVFHETPIEREIRLAQEREEELRRSRGMSQSSGRGEMVRIKTRRSLPSFEPERTFEKTQVSFINNSKIQKENQRGEDHQQAEQIQKPVSRDPPPQLDNKKKESDPQYQNKRNGNMQESDPETDEVFLSPCCPHRHPDESWIFQTKPANSSLSSFTPRGSEGRRQTVSFSSPSVPLTPTTSREIELTQSWRKSLGSTGLQSRVQGAPEFIEKEIEENLKRELELRELRESMKETSQATFSPAPLVEQAVKTTNSQFYPQVKTDKPLTPSSFSPRVNVRTASLSFVTAKPWSSMPSPGSSSSPLVRKVPRGVTDTLLQDFEEYRAKMMLEESAYAGIQPVDDINNEVVESTRVVRHKNQRALLWEAGHFLNQDPQ
ncbi:mitotic interactor and substrate of PLK1 isoform X1 [Cyprinodon tularosa]|uniref:mitotic interactor and substrate of PLK1 isoform X1 n=2 Tax=Cyprinodon tularosa TaxID=77115 RepID=UPI0018E1F71D|nr:mitotic interactor and substrate of PLK1 isoform X1 [Cyprinodon tularosa]XP_038153158.1 mitotic interactor and substrate of PLK1 isoform X1 [Cyprinodon tularosa]